MRATICEYANQCPIYNGEKQIMDTPIVVYRNVFCKRGEKGWNNCKQHMEFKTEKLIKEQ